MSSNLTQQLQRELKNHPIKAGALALLAVVALWFWAPLVVGLFGDDSMSETSTPATSPAAVTTTATTANPAAVAPNDNAPAGQLKWTELVELMAADPLKQPLAKVSYSRDPFAAMTELQVDGAAGTQSTTDSGNLPNRPLANNEGAPVQVDAQGEPIPPAGPLLMGTAIGLSRRSAVIDGRAIQEGEFVLARDGKRYFVERILARKVVLRDGSKTLILTQGNDATDATVDDGSAIIRRTAS